MYPLLIASGLSISILLSLLFIPHHPFYFLGPFLSTLAFFPTFILLSRRVANRVRPLFEQAQRIAKTGNVDKAVETLQGALRYARWQLFLGQQINTQLGVLYYSGGKEKQASEYLAKGYPRVSEGHLMLAAIQYREKQADQARETLEKGIKFNKKSPILYNFLAWILAKEGKRDEAVAILERCLKKAGADEDTQDNLDRLRNDKRMNMRAFGDLWFSLKFEVPKGMGLAQAPVRKGFRQPPKNKGKRARSR